ncbi:unnamed protein product [Arctogadus glacialis]
MVLRVASSLSPDQTLGRNTALCLCSSSVLPEKEIQRRGDGLNRGDGRPSPRFRRSQDGGTSQGGRRGEEENIFSTLLASSGGYDTNIPTLVQRVPVPGCQPCGQPLPALHTAVTPSSPSPLEGDQQAGGLSLFYA